MKNNKHLRNFVLALAFVLVIAIVLAAVIFIDRLNNEVSEKLTVEQAQELLDSTLDGLPNNVSEGAKYIRENTKVTVTGVDYGYQKDIILSCTYETIDVYSSIHSNINDLLGIQIEDPNTGKPKNATKIQLEIQPKLMAILENAEKVNGEIEIYVYETQDAGLLVYLEDKTIDTIFGGILSAHSDINATNEITINGELTDISNRNSLRSGLIACFSFKNYDAAKPDTSSKIQKMWNEFKDEFYRNFIEENRWTYLAKGLGTTLAITALSLVLGLIIGFIVAIIRCTAATTGKLKLIDGICRIYLSIMRGTPVMIQLMIIYFVLLLPLGIEKFVAAVLCFGINSGAYVAEIVRGGIMSIDGGQHEAGRSLGLGYVPTMCYIIVPQAIKAILPSLANEFIALLKETSVAFYIGVADLTQGGLKIRSITYSNFMPLIAIAIVYLILVLGLSYLVSLLERRMRKSDRS